MVENCNHNMSKPIVKAIGSTGRHINVNQLQYVVKVSTVRRFTFARIDIAHARVFFFYESAEKYYHIRFELRGF